MKEGELRKGGKKRGRGETKGRRKEGKMTEGKIER